MAFSDEAIRAVVNTAQDSDPRANDWTARCLIERQNKIGRAFLTDVLAIDNFSVHDGRLQFDDLAVKYGYMPPRGYTFAWSEFDNASGRKTPIPAASDARIPQSAAAYLCVNIQSGDPRKAVTVYLRNESVVGVDRTW